LLFLGLKSNYQSYDMTKITKRMTFELEKELELDICQEEDNRE